MRVTEVALCFATVLGCCCTLQVFYYLILSETAVFPLWGHRKTGIILFWAPPKGSAWPPEGLKFGEKCTVTYNRNQLRRADVVVFHYTSFLPKDLPWKHSRRSDQLFVWWSSDNPGDVKQNLGLTNSDLREFDNGFFNWTMTYMNDADVVRSYGSRWELINQLEKGKSVVDQIISDKTKIAMWKTDQCNGSQNARMRTGFAKELMDSGLKLDIFGDCLGSKMTDHPTSKQMKAYKFYLSFEDAVHCRNYITEKFWDNALRNDMVPVVWGPTKEDVLAVAPIHSFIHTDDFESPAKLTEYLQFLDQNDDEYRKYFRWREDESMTDEKMIQMIQKEHPDIRVQGRTLGLCEKEFQNTGYKTVHSIVDDFFIRNRLECTEYMP
uniref:Fucosyltransferase n=1 Tax=Ciona savignyi TaxID=51511 RepID=Q6A1E8_CIOSA|nr:alpha3-fucosyltransferase [Ciona savignyi]